MTDAIQTQRPRRQAYPRLQTNGFGAFLVATLLLAALILVAINLIEPDTTERSSLIPLDQPAAWSGFTA